MITHLPYRAPKSQERDSTRNGASAIVVDKEAEELERMEKLFKKHEMNEIPRVEWLDQLVFRGTERRRLKAARNSIKSIQRHSASFKDTKDLENKPEQNGGPELEDGLLPRPGPSKFALNIELPRFDFPVVFADHEYSPPPISSFQHLSASQSNIILKPPPEVSYGPWDNGPEERDRIIRIYDPEVGAKDNPAESKHRRLVRSQHRHGILDKDLKPNAKVRDELNMIMSYSPTHVLLPEEKDLVWKFRYHT